MAMPEANDKLNKNLLIAQNITNVIKATMCHIYERESTTIIQKTFLAHFKLNFKLCFIPLFFMSECCTGKCIDDTVASLCKS